MRNVAVLTVLAIAWSSAAFAQTPSDVDTIRALEDRFRDAKLARDIKALDTLYHPDFYSTNQTGNSRTRAEALELWTWFSVQQLTNEIHRIHVSGNTALVSGRTHEVSGTGTEPFLFTRVYVRTPAGWKMLSNMQAWPMPGGRQVSTSTKLPAAAGTPAPTRVTTQSGLSVEEVRVGGSCVIVVSRSEKDPVAVAPCSQDR